MTGAIYFDHLPKVYLSGFLLRTIPAFSSFSIWFSLALLFLFYTFIVVYLGVGTDFFSFSHHIKLLWISEITLDSSVLLAPITEYVV
jgi:hypothetical protein